MTRACVIAVVLGLVFPCSAWGEQERAPVEPDEAGAKEELNRPTPFDQFRVQFTFGLGGSLYSGNQYFAIAAGGLFFVIDGLGVGLEVDQWFGPSPKITKVSPEVRYVFHQLFPYSPYVGVFYRHWFLWYDDRPYGDADALGVRGGVIWSAWVSGGISLGLAYEGVVSPCSSGCHYVVPEIGVSFGF